VPGLEARPRPAGAESSRRRRLPADPPGTWPGQRARRRPAAVGRV